VADLALPETALAEGEAGAASPASGTGAALVEPASREAPAAAELPDDLATYLDGVERDILVRALERYRCNRTAAGASMGLSLRQMRYRMARLGVVVDGDGIGAEGS
jgi:two-component system response regulator PilR (NtrC family)